MFDVNQWIEENRDPFIAVSDQVWEYAELGYVEDKSAKALADILTTDGFQVTMGIGEMDTAFVAEYGTGGPVIGFLGEYDALPGMSQAVSTEQQPLEEGAPGHACQHNLLGSAALASAMAVKAAIEAGEATGTVRYYGCPAEESDPAKGFMVREGVFDDCDIAITWHPGNFNAAPNMNSQAVLPLYFRFHGVTAHAAADPENGRSALDAVELTNVGANYLREHIPTDGRIHYIITSGGLAPNIVPDFAEVEYWVRAAEMQTVMDIYERVCKVAKGAAMMTETEVEIIPGNGLFNILPNTVIARVLHDSLSELADIDFTTEEVEFAKKVIAEIPDAALATQLAELPVDPNEMIPAIRENPLMQPRAPYSEEIINIGGSTDVGNVSYAVPTSQITTLTAAIGSPGHSWQNVAQGAMSIGHKGMLHAAKAMALGGLRFMADPELVQQAKDEFAKRSAGKDILDLLPADAKPDLDKYRA